jgi:hypothetical protein
MTQQAQGSFEVSTQPKPPSPGEGLARFSLEKRLHGDLEGVSRGEMLAGGDHTKGEAGYVAIEHVTGTLHGRQGGFALQHFATMSRAGRVLQVVVVPGSGSGELQGIAGTFTIVIAAGQHSYDFAYTLPDPPRP